MTTFNIAVYTDTICPWCYIAHKSLDQAISLYQKTYPGGRHDAFNFTFLPYYLDATAPSKGIPWEERVAQKNGQDAVNAIRTRLERVGRANGIAFGFNSRIGKTKDSHRLLKWARDKGGEGDQQKRLLETIFEWHFERDGDITDRQGLVTAVIASNLPEAEALQLLESDDCGA
ncbi:hypothetical protein CLAFUW4_03285 [Fulvia fulva]|uniref:DSBA-like thioredoxin domain-containing protein n=1 Tax=Passalora fulva TaxID=5499 RepID=A0A9Q8L9Q2_PASFU|nr:uncharacterized protein CLAFUR5_03266 [Fulvia fulva]KAK4632194.1 hypothetical protein CLAFUR4_03274 [Fulvia fulva]UJO13521.1 hypothetical protein CLAFUR5_03266 [Fulvia fulva]WPV10847.1 hypothetical protein CLAFUW4_03285 [Fulvia fulva]WPV26317.1 hypothetical protein CLAFUW7_03278 [Fulvia fulva]